MKKINNAPWVTVEVAYGPNSVSLTGLFKRFESCIKIGWVSTAQDYHFCYPFVSESTMSTKFTPFLRCITDFFGGTIHGFFETFYQPQSKVSGRCEVNLFISSILFWYLCIYSKNQLFFSLPRFYDANYLWFNLLLLYTDELVGLSPKAINLLIDTTE